MEDETIKVSKRSLHEAISLVLGEEHSKKESRQGIKKVCGSSSLKAFNFQKVTRKFNSDSLSDEILEELRSSLLQMDNRCSDTVTLIQGLLSFNSNHYLPIIWKSAVALFLTENPANQDHLGEFLEMCTNQRLPEEKDNLLKLLLTLPDSLEGYYKSVTNNGNSDLSNSDISEFKDDSV